MKRLFVLGVIGAVLFEIANIYFIMPFPGSQRRGSIDLAYAIHQWRWVARIAFGLMIAAGLGAVWRGGRWWREIGAVAILGTAGIAWIANFRMAADHMFLPPGPLRMVTAENNRVAPDRLVVGVSRNGEARAYPIQFLGYHHQVRDVVGGEAVLVSYCTVCRTGRVFSPLVDDKPESFRLVGMDQWNAMLEDDSTGSWWRQANGVAVAGPRKGQSLREIGSLQVTLRHWLELNPHSRIMQADPASVDRYSPTYEFEDGSSRRELTGTDPTSWGEKSWVVGIALDGESKAYDWNHLRDVRVINDEIGSTAIVLVLAADSASFHAFVRPDASMIFTLEGETLVAGDRIYALDGRNPVGDLERIPASQEFWHSWRTFQPETRRYPRHSIGDMPADEFEKTR